VGRPRQAARFPWLSFVVRESTRHAAERSLAYGELATSIGRGLSTGGIAPARVAFVTGKLAAATMAWIGGMPAPAAETTSATTCPATYACRGAEDLTCSTRVQFPGDAGPLFAHQARHGTPSRCPDSR